MRTIWLLAFLFQADEIFAQDVFTRGLVYQIPEMNKVVERKSNLYKKVNDTSLTFDLYYPQGFKFNSTLPVVIFNNGVGGMEIPRWGIYKDWAKLVAANGMIAVNYQSRNGNTLQDGEALIDHLVSNADDLNIDPGKIGIWTCSANARTGMRLSYKTRPHAIKALVVYYGNPDSLGELRQDLPTLIVRAGLDAQFINTGIDNFIQASLQQDIRLEVINYLNGIHAFDAFTNTAEAKDIIVRTIGFLKVKLSNPVSGPAHTLTNKRFMWLIMNDRINDALSEFRNARLMYRADSNFHPFYNAAIREDVLIANAYWLLNHQRQSDAVELFKLAAESYPESPNAFESLSEAYELTGNKAEAITNARKAIEKLPQATGINENFKQLIRRGAEDRIKRLEEAGSLNQPPVRAHHDLVYDAENKAILLTGGSTPLNGGNAFIFYNDLWMFDSKWKPAGIAGDTRSGMRLAYDTRRKKIFSFGGFSGNTSLGDLRMLDNGQWKTISNDEQMRAAEPGFVYDIKRDRLIAFGGSAPGRNVNNITWEWNGESWKQFNGEGPGGRQAFVMIYDSKRNKVVLFGGMDATGKNYPPDVWEFDGTQWKRYESMINPGPRIAAGTAFDSKRGVMLLFGGMVNGTAQSDTWSWDGKEWKQLAVSGPPSRSMGYMAYDINRDRIVLFGGRSSWPNDVNDTWEWDGSKWEEKK